MSGLNMEMSQYWEDRMVGQVRDDFIMPAHNSGAFYFLLVAVLTKLEIIVGGQLNLSFLIY